MRQVAKKLNLMLLSVHEALCVHNTTYKAANALGITQPAVSRYLKQLRYLMDDELFVRTSNGLEPTALGYVLLQEARQILDLSEKVLTIRTDIFDPAIEERQFTFGGHYFVSENLYKIFSESFYKKYPGIKVNILNMTTEGAIDSMEHRMLDLLIGDLSIDLPKHFHLKNISKTSFKVLCSRHNRNFDKGTISRSDFINTPHVYVPRDTGPSPIDIRLKKDNLLQKNLLSVPYNHIAIDIVANSNYLLMVDPVIIKPYLNENLKVLEPNFTLPVSSTDLMWHRRHDNDPAHKWMREYIEENIMEVFARPVPLPKNAD